MILSDEIVFNFLWARIVLPVVIGIHESETYRNQFFIHYIIIRNILNVNLYLIFTYNFLCLDYELTCKFACFVINFGFKYDNIEFRISLFKDMFIT